MQCQDDHLIRFLIIRQFAQSNGVIVNECDDVGLGEGFFLFVDFIMVPLNCFSITSHVAFMAYSTVVLLVLIYCVVGSIHRGKKQDCQCLTAYVVE